MAPSIHSIDSTPYLISGSISTCDDIEGGYSSHEDECDRLIVPKHITIGGRTRRLSQCNNLPTRRCAKREEDTHSSHQESPMYIQCMKQQTSNDTAPRVNPHTLFFGVIFFLLTTSITYYSQQTQIQSLHRQVKVLHQARRHVEESHGKLTQELKTVSHNLAQHKSTHEKMKEVNYVMSEHMRRLKEERSTEQAIEAYRRAEQAEDRLQSIVDSIRSASTQQVLEKYGPGPHVVELTVMLPGHQNFDTIKLDLASIDTANGMPHAVHTFLDQVSLGAWNGAFIGFHAGHVLLAVPSPSESSTPVPTILFPEYNKSYQHEEYTVAFPGRPGTGQDFYINVQSNVMNHAPRVQDGKYIEGEPCFAKITDRNSRKIIDAMDKIPVNRNGSLQDRVIIKEARIVSYEES